MAFHSAPSLSSRRTIPDRSSFSFPLPQRLAGPKGKGREKMVVGWGRHSRGDGGVRLSFQPQDLEANFREHWPDSFPSRLHPRRSFSFFLFHRVSASFTFFLSPFRHWGTEDYCRKETQKYRLTAEPFLYERRKKRMLKVEERGYFSYSRTDLKV